LKLETFFMLYASSFKLQTFGLFVGFALFVVSHRFMNFPLSLFLYLKETVFLKYIFVILAKYSGLVLIFLYFFLLISKRICPEPYERKNKIFSIFVLLLSLILSFGLICLTLKSLFFFPRPFVFYNFSPFISFHSSSSLPSAHICFFFPFSLAIYFLNKKWGIFSLILVILMGISRVFAGVHYFSDILLGFAIGGICFLFAFKLLKRFV